MLEFLTIPLLATHLLAMDLASSGPLVGVWLRWRRGRPAGAIGKQLIWWSVFALLIGMTTGGLLILVIPGPWLWGALERFPADAYWFALVELVFSLGCMVVIAVGWQRLNRWAIVALAILSAANLLYHFPPLMAVIGKLASNPQFTTAEIIDRATLLELFTRGEVLALSFHFGFASLAVSAITVLYMISTNRLPGEPAEYRSVARIASGIALMASLIQIPVGVWLLLCLPGTARMALMGKSLGGSLAFVVSMVLSLVLLQRLFAAMLGEVDRKNLRTTVVLTCLVVLLMTASLRLSRSVPATPQAETKTALDASVQG